MLGENSEGILREQSVVLALLKAVEMLLLFPIAPDFTQSLSAFMSAAESVEHSRIFSSSQRADFVFCKRRWTLAGTGAFLIKQTP